MASSFFSSIVKVNLSTKAKLRSCRLRSSKSRSCFYLSNVPGIRPHTDLRRAYRQIPIDPADYPLLDPPGPIDNSNILFVKGNTKILRSNSEHGQLSQETWRFLHDIYGGGPLLCVEGRKEIEGKKEIEEKQDQQEQDEQLQQG